MNDTLGHLMNCRQAEAEHGFCVMVKTWEQEDQDGSETTFMEWGESDLRMQIAG